MYAIFKKDRFLKIIDIPVTAFLRLIRLPNLLIIAATQYLMRYCIISPFLKLNGFEVQLDNLHFFIMVISTVLLAAAGYIINDYFDLYTDRLNKPKKVIIDNLISRKSAMIMHVLMNITGIALGIYLSFYIKLPGLAVVFILPAGLLWFYSTNYKRQFLIGNILVSLMAAGVPMLVIFYELPLLNKTYGSVMINNQANFNYIFFWVAGFSFFAFIITLLREIIKDSEDFEGDNAYGMNTIPIALGTQKTKVVILSLIVISVVLLLWVLLKYILFTQDFTDYFSAVYFLLLLAVPFFILFIRIVHARSKKDYYIASQLTKCIMLSGILYAFLVRYIVLYRLS